MYADASPVGEASRIVDWLTAGQGPQPVGMSAGIAGCTSGPMLKYISMPAFIWYSCMYRSMLSQTLSHLAKDHLLRRAPEFKVPLTLPCGSGKARHLQPITVSTDAIHAHIVVVVVRR